MPGLWVTRRQVRRYMERRRQGDSQAVASAKAGFSERTARRVEAGGVNPAPRAPRQWRTRSDPLADVWDELIVPMLRQVPYLRATSIIEQINLQHPGRLDERHRRTLQRRIAINP
jgi:hypothetical protein